MRSPRVDPHQRKLDGKEEEKLEKLVLLILGWATMLNVLHKQIELTFLYHLDQAFAALHLRSPLLCTR